LAVVYLLWNGSTWLGATAEQGGWAALLALAFTLPGYGMRRLGAGDVKLMTALGLATDGRFMCWAYLSAPDWPACAGCCWRQESGFISVKGLESDLRYLEPGLSKTTLRALPAGGFFADTGVAPLGIRFVQSPKVRLLSYNASCTDLAVGTGTVSL
jgi:hypothetical protein